MRKFRGLNKDGKWVEGWYCKVEGKSYIIPDDSKMVQVDYTLVLGVVGFVAVDHKTVGQYTGLKDVNGKEIYKDTIIEVWFGEEKLIYVCDWYDEIGAWVFRGNGEWLMYEDVFETCKIIGDKNTNPKLLETKNE